MPAERAPAGLAVHATAVAIGKRALLITGRSGAGKSGLAAALLAVSAQRRRIALIGDDRVLLTLTERDLRVRPHPRIAGFIERRGLGFVAVPWCEDVSVAGVAALDDHGAALPRRLDDLPVLRVVAVDDATRARAVLAWWSDRGKDATPAHRLARAEASRS